MNTKDKRIFYIQHFLKLSELYFSLSEKLVNELNEKSKTGVNREEYIPSINTLLRRPS